MKQDFKTMFWTDQVQKLHKANPSVGLYVSPSMLTMLDLVENTSEARNMVRKMVLEWAASPKRWKQAIPEDHDNAISFEYRDAHVYIKAQGDGDDWHFHVEHDDSRNPRVWVTEVMVSYDEYGSMVGVRNACTAFGQTTPTYSTPAVLKSMIQAGMLKDFEMPVGVAPVFVTDKVGIDNLVDFLDDQNRTLPVMIFTPLDENGVYPLDVRMIAYTMQGVAHVFALDSWAEREWNKEFGRALGAFGGAIRTYLPMLNRAQPEKHPLLLHRSMHGKKPAELESILIRCSFRTNSHQEQVFKEWEDIQQSFVVKPEFPNAVAV